MNSQWKKEGKKNISDKFKKIFKEDKQITAGLAFKANICCLGKLILDFQKEKLIK